MTVQCVTCEHFTLRDSPMAREGYGKCAVGKSYRFESALYSHLCEKHVELDAEQVQKRRQWLEARR